MYGVLYALQSSQIRLLVIIQPFLHSSNIYVLGSKDISINETDTLYALMDLVFWRLRGIPSFVHLLIFRVLLTSLPKLCFVQDSFSSYRDFKAKFSLSLTYKVPLKLDLLLTFASLGLKYEWEPHTICLKI